MRTGFDVVTGYKTDQHMTLPHWLRRVIFLETVAGVPGMVRNVSNRTASGGGPEDPEGPQGEGAHIYGVYSQ
eukprot:2932485-Pyramimonas_sp.AAC.1